MIRTPWKANLLKRDQGYVNLIILTLKSSLLLAFPFATTHHHLSTSARLALGFKDEPLYLSTKKTLILAQFSSHICQP